MGDDDDGAQPKSCSELCKPLESSFLTVCRRIQECEKEEEEEEEEEGEEEEE